MTLTIVQLKRAVELCDIRGRAQSELLTLRRGMDNIASIIVECVDESVHTDTPSIRFEVPLDVVREAIVKHFEAISREAEIDLAELGIILGEE